MTCGLRAPFPTLVSHKNPVCGYSTPGEFRYGLGWKTARRSHSHDQRATPGIAPLSITCKSLTTR